jgi:hypothetical protein
VCLWKEGVVNKVFSCIDTNCKTDAYVFLSYFLIGIGFRIVDVRYYCNILMMVPYAIMMRRMTIVVIAVVTTALLLNVFEVPAIDAINWWG